jgi:hypothetical protein
MNWWKNLLEGRRLRPQTVALLDPRNGRSLEMSDSLRGWLAAAFSVGEGTKDREAEALGRLRADPERALAAVASAYEQAPEGDYAGRWALVYAASVLETPASLAFLERVLREPIPPERSNDIHHFSTVAEETSLRCRAIHGIAALASHADDPAVESLLNQLTHPSYTVRVTACQALRELPGRPVADDVIYRRLPAEEADRVFAVRRALVEEMVTPVEARARAAVPRPPGGESGREISRFGERRPPQIGSGRNYHG